MMTWCESQERIDYLFGQAKNERLLKLLKGEMEEAKKQFEATGLASRVFGEKRYRTLDSWSCERRVVGKAVRLEKGANPRFAVTSLRLEQYDARARRGHFWFGSCESSQREYLRPYTSYAKNSFCALYLLEHGCLDKHEVV
jgi:hypothetical protein